jgi:hypothetical protein
MTNNEFLYLILILQAAAPSGTRKPPDGDLHQGYIRITSEAEIFRPCGSDQSLWLDYSSGTRTAIFTSYERLRTGPDAETYVVLRGATGPQLECAHCSEYPGSFKVNAVIEHKATAPGNCG